MPSLPKPQKGDVLWNQTVSSEQRLKLDDGMIFYEPLS
jgi:hypothetical protein